MYYLNGSCLSGNNVSNFDSSSNVKRILEIYFKRGLNRREKVINFIVIIEWSSFCSKSKIIAELNEVEVHLSFLQR